MNFADNPISKKYQEMESSTDWLNASNDEQLKAMQGLTNFLLSCPGNTPIYDWAIVDIVTGHRSVTTALDKIEQIRRRIERFERLIAS